MKKILICCVCWIFTHTAFAEVVLPNLPIGSQYQLVFLTSGTMEGSSNHIEDYNKFVQAQAAINSFLPSANWRAIASTDTTDAIDNAPTFPSIPIYTTSGKLVANGSGQLWQPTPASWGIPSADILDNPIQYDQNGLLLYPMYGVLYTGTGTDGHKQMLSGTSCALGEGETFRQPAVGSSTEIDRNWIFGGIVGGNSGQGHFYALSSPITVVPEPSTILLLFVGISIILLKKWM